MTFPFPQMPPSQGAATISFTASAVNTANATTHTFSGVSIGTAASNRKIVVASQHSSGTVPVSVSSMTVGGISATFVVNQASADGEAYVEIWQANVPTGTTATIVVNYSGTVSRGGVGVWAVYGAAAAATDTGVSTANPLTDTLNIPAGGVAIGAASGSAGTSTAWTNLTENYDENVEASTYQSGASSAFATIQTALAISTNGYTGQACFACASWGPA
jgi:hypothetical protein